MLANKNNLEWRSRPELETTLPNRTATLHEVKRVFSMLWSRTRIFSLLQEAVKVRSCGDRAGDHWAVLQRCSIVRKLFRSFLDGMQWPCGSCNAGVLLALLAIMTSDMAALKVTAISALSSSWHAQSPANELTCVLLSFPTCALFLLFSPNFA